MQAIATKYNSNEIVFFGFEPLTENELNIVRGGGTPKSRDKDIFDFEEE